MKLFEGGIGTPRKVFRVFFAFNVKYASEASISRSLEVRRQPDGQTGNTIILYYYYTIILLYMERKSALEIIWMH